MAAIGLPILQELAQIILERTQAGPGFVIVSGERLDGLSDAQLVAMTFGLSQIMGSPMAQNATGERLVLVADARPSDVTNARGYLTNESMLLHTDASDLAGLLCLNPSFSGGATLLASAGAIQDVLADTVPDLLHEYYRVWSWNVGNLQVPGGESDLASPIFSTYAGALSCRYGSFMLRQAFSRGEGALTDLKLAALDCFESVARHPDLLLRHRLQRGEVIWMNNYKVLHGREPFRDGDDPSLTRRYLRIWVRLAERPRLAQAFAAFDDHLLGRFEQVAQRVASR